MGRQRLGEEYRRRKTSVSLKPAVWQAFLVRCQDDGLSASAQIENLMVEWLAGDPDKQLNTFDEMVVGALRRRLNLEGTNDAEPRK